MANVKSRLESGEKWWGAEIVLRSFGLFLLGLCSRQVSWLSTALHQPMIHGARPMEVVVAAAIFLSGSIGFALLLEGAGLFRLVDLPARHMTFTY